MTYPLSVVKPQPRLLQVLDALLGEVLRTPSFQTREVERLKAERMAELLKLRAEPRGLADELFTRVLYERGSR